MTENEVFAIHKLRTLRRRLDQSPSMLKQTIGDTADEVLLLLPDKLTQKGDATLLEMVNTEIDRRKLKQ